MSASAATPARAQLFLFAHQDDEFGVFEVIRQRAQDSHVV